MNTQKITRIPEKVEVNVDIFGIIIGADRTLLNVNIGNGYKIEEVFLDDCKYKKEIINGNGYVCEEYFFSQIKNEMAEKEKISFICITKSDKFICPFPSIYELTDITDKPFFYEDMKIYQDREYKIINDFIWKMMLFKEGDIGIKGIFFSCKSQLLIEERPYVSNIFIRDANTLCSNVYSINQSEIEAVNGFLRNYNHSFELLKDVIANFTYSYKLLSDEESLKKLVTVNEILFLGKNQAGKKEVLSKRMAVFLGADDEEIYEIYNQIKRIYKYRSDSIHEGISSNITKLELIYLKEYTRKAIKKYLNIVETEIAANPSNNFLTIKNQIILSLKEKVKLVHFFNT